MSIRDRVHPTRWVVTRTPALGNGYWKFTLDCGHFVVRMGPRKRVRCEHCPFIPTKAKLR